MGISEDRFWGLTPRTIQPYYKAYKLRQEVREQEIWLQGAYFKSALQSSIVVSALADKGTKDKMPEYPECPHQDKAEVVLTEEQAEQKRQHIHEYYKRLAEIQRGQR